MYILYNLYCTLPYSVISRNDVVIIIMYNVTVHLGLYVDAYTQYYKQVVASYIYSGGCMIISRLAGVRMLSQECRPEPSKGLWMSLRTRLYTRYIYYE